MKIILSLITALFLSAGPAQALDASKPEAAIPAAEKKLSTSQQRMKDCNKDAGDLKGMKRQDFMRECMHDAKPAEQPSMSQQARMGYCAKLSKGKQGPELRAFMSECLRKQ